MSKMLDHILPPMPAFLDMVSAQAELLAKCMLTAADCLTDPDPIRFQALADIERSAKELRQRHLDKLSDSYSTPIDRTDLLQAINSLETPVEAMVEAMEEMRALQVTSDNYCLEMAVVMREAASALERGYSKLATKPGLAKPDAEMAIQCPNTVDKIYRKGIAKLFTVDPDDVRTRDPEIQIATFIHTVEILKRREAYRHLRNISGQVGDAAEVLHSIVMQIG
ncbi:MAG: DUF47 family protein [Magnetococcales bacterium]|nr:DUF47 family protein [Magnetococcales bacterium]NGZ05299.1 DUF47 family protein [Magnetococcales bacterium]